MNDRTKNQQNEINPSRNPILYETGYLFMSQSLFVMFRCCRVTRGSDGRVHWRRLHPVLDVLILVGSRRVTGVLQALMRAVTGVSVCPKMRQTHRRRSARGHRGGGGYLGVFPGRVAHVRLRDIAIYVVDVSVWYLVVA